MRYYFEHTAHSTQLIVNKTLSAVNRQLTTETLKGVSYAS